MAKVLISEHHFTAATKSPSFFLEPKGLLPYSIDAGNWFVKVIFVAVAGNVKGSSRFPRFARITSPHVVDGNNRSLLLGIVRLEAGAPGDCALAYSPSLKIVYKTDKLCFNIEHIEGGAPTEFEGNAEILVGFSLQLWK